MFGFILFCFCLFHLWSLCSASINEMLWYKNQCNMYWFTLIEIMFWDLFIQTAAHYTESSSKGSQVFKRFVPASLIPVY